MKRRHPARTDPARWARLRQEVFDAANWRCASCGAAGRMELDHVTPVRSGGAWWSRDNLQCLCAGCHIEKSRTENRKQLTPAQQAWADFAASL